MNSVQIAAIIGACTAIAAGSAALAEDRTAVAPDWTSWTVRVEPLVWAPALRGDFRLPGGGGSIDVEDVNADEIQAVPAGIVTIRAAEWSFLFRGFGFSLDEDETRIDLAGFDLTAGYRVWTPINDAERSVRLSVDLFGGARVHNLDVKLADEQADNTWAEPIGGVRLELELPEGFGLGVSIDGGGFGSGDDSSFSWDITVAFSWRPTEHVGLQIGFRHLQMDLATGEGNDEFEFDAALAGLFGGLVIRF